jgi:threonine dehydrogenase-like Zn-dependent dehydrogenase
MVTGVAADRGRLRMAESIGAVPVDIEDIDPMVVLHRLQADGADVVYETSGVAATLDQAVAMCRRGGRIGLIGLCHESGVFRSTPVVLKELALIGSRGYNETTWSIMMSVLPGVCDDVRKLVTHEVAFEDFETALTLVQNREGSKVILRP